MASQMFADLIVDYKKGHEESYKVTDFLQSNDPNKTTSTSTSLY